MVNLHIQAESRKKETHQEKLKNLYKSRQEDEITILWSLSHLKQLLTKKQEKSAVGDIP